MKADKLSKFKKSLCKNWEFPEKGINTAYEKYATEFEQYSYEHLLLLKDLVELKTKGMSK